MDIVGRETLEEMLKNYSGTLLFVSHDRYFIKKISDSLLSFETDGVKFYPYGYGQYLEMKEPPKAEEKASVRAPSPKKNYTTPAKEKSRYERSIKKAEEKISLLEENLGGLKEEINWQENSSDYMKLSELQTEIDDCEAELDAVMNEWETLNSEYEEFLESIPTKD